MGRSILIAVDDSDNAERAVKFYNDSVRIPDDSLTLVHCAETKFRSVNRSVVKTSAPPGGGYSLDTLHEVIAASEHESKGIEAKYQKLLQEKGVTFRMVTRFGKPGESIVELLEEEKPTMIIMGTRGMNRLRRTVMGSVSSYVINHVSCPVLIVRE